MQNNPKQQIHTDYRIDDVFKPEAANQLARSIHYDFVITQKMLDNYLEKHPAITSLDIGNLIASNEDGTDGTWGTPVKAPVSIYIAAKTSANDTYTWVFGGRLLGYTGSGSDYIVNCDDFMINGQYDFATTRDMVNVYTAYPYRLYAAVAGINHWTTPLNYVKIEPNVPQNYGVFKVGTYSMPGSYDMEGRETFQIVSQNAMNGMFIINPTEGQVESGYTPAVVYADWMGGGGGVTTGYTIKGLDMSEPTTVMYGLYQQMGASTSIWNTEPILSVLHNHHTSRYQLSNWDSLKFTFSNVSEGKVVIVHKNGNIEWKNSGSKSGGSSDVIVFQDDGVMIPYLAGRKFVSLDPTGLVSEDTQVRYSLLQDGQFVTYDNQTADVPLFKTPNSSNEYGLRPEGINHIIWNTWYGITAYGRFEGDEATDPLYVKTILNGSSEHATPGLNGLSRMYIVTDALVDGLVYELTINIRSIARIGLSDTGTIIEPPSGELYGTMIAPSRYTNHFSLQFYTSTGTRVTPKRWADSSKDTHYTLYPRFNSVPSNGEGTGFHIDHPIGVGSLPPVLATAKVYFVKIDSNIYVMSY